MLSETEILNPMDHELEKKTGKKKGTGNVGSHYSRSFLGARGAFCLMAFFLLAGNTAMAAEVDGIISTSFDTLFSLVANIISAIGSILTLWGIGEWGIAFQTQDGGTQAHAFKRIAGGLVMILAPQIITLFTA